MLDVQVKKDLLLAQLSRREQDQNLRPPSQKASRTRPEAVANIVKDPVGTAKAVPGGVARFAKESAHTGEGHGRQHGRQPEGARRTAQRADKAQDAAVAGASAAGDALVAGKQRVGTEDAASPTPPTGRFSTARRGGVDSLPQRLELRGALDPRPRDGPTADKFVYDLHRQASKSATTAARARGVRRSPRAQGAVRQPQLHPDRRRSSSTRLPRSARPPGSPCSCRSRPSRRRRATPALHPPLRADVRRGGEGSGRLAFTSRDEIEAVTPTSGSSCRRRSAAGVERDRAGGGAVPGRRSARCGSRASPRTGQGRSWGRRASRWKRRVR